jgi:hypothetical protein
MITAPPFTIGGLFTRTIRFLVFRKKISIWLLGVRHICGLSKLVCNIYMLVLKLTLTLCADPVNVDRMIWPRGSAVAEVLWSGAKDSEGRNRSQIDAALRLSEMRERLVNLGVGAEPIQMPYCTMEGNVCQLGYAG